MSPDARSPARIQRHHGPRYDVLRKELWFLPAFLVEVSEAGVNKKIEALSKYTTYAERYYFSEDVRSTAIRHGALAERPYAEGFDIIRIVGEFEAPA